ncbi:LysE family translocator [Aeromonas dhakensis]|uniref:LysE family translocator n=1 Tax=Aeromonas dhakensis TaxID=196024 RepID=UPI00289280D7|nr:LysE family translocator [Aeromonas dhakensis]MDX7697930.1 LysE family translocator [Aeromonas dhakensis]HDX8642195.1 LysE family translocator [Aeromonas dhakensis]
MIDSTLFIFITTSLLIVLAPGQDMVLVLSSSIARGPKAGVITASGVATGLLGHTFLVALGLGALLQASELAFDIMKYVGAAYLFYLGVKLFKASAIGFDNVGDVDGNMSSFFFKGMISNISNPKIAVFYFAYLPQFVSVDSASSTQALLFLGASFAFLTFLVKLPIGYLAGVLSPWMQSKPAVQIGLNRSCSVILIGMAVNLLFLSQL